jgi:hypothetical protein
MAGRGQTKTGGRKKGVKNKASVKREAEIKASGITPLEYMLGVLRDPDSSDEDKRWAAEHAAPYCHPRLNAVNLSGGVTMTHEEALDQLDGDEPAPAK